MPRHTVAELERRAKENGRARSGESQERPRGSRCCSWTTSGIPTCPCHDHTHCDRLGPVRRGLGHGMPVPGALPLRVSRAWGARTDAAPVRHSGVRWSLPSSDGTH